MAGEGEDFPFYKPIIESVEDRGRGRSTGLISFFEFRYSVVIFILYLFPSTLFYGTQLLFSKILILAPNPWANRLVNSGEKEGGTVPKLGL